MSTRAQIDIVRENGKRVRVYHHFDGYFNGVGLELKCLLETSPKNADDFLSRILKRRKAYEVTKLNHGDIEYYYLIDYKRHCFLGWKVSWKKQKIWNHGRCEIDKGTAINLTQEDLRFYQKC